MNMSQDDVIEIKEIVKQTLLEEKENNQNSLKFIYEKFSVYGLLLILLFGLLDYFTFVDSFNFSPASFLTICLFNTSLFDSTLLIIIIFFPLILMSLLFLMPYLAVIASVRINNKTEWEFSKLFFIPIISVTQTISTNNGLIKSCFYWMKDNGHFDAIRLSLVFNFIFISSSLIIFYSINPSFTNIWMYLLGILIPIFLGFLMTTPYIKSRNTLVQNRSFSSLFLLWNVPIFLFLSSLLLFIPSDEFKSLLGIMLLIMIIPLIVSSQVVNFYSINTINNSALKLPPLVFAAIIIPTMVAITGYFYNTNQKIWADNNLSTNGMSFNLFINKHFLCSNDTIIDVNITNIVIPKKFQIDKKRLKTKLDESSFYLPISKESSLYFNNDYENNKTIIYAINKKDDKNEVLALGYLDQIFTK